MNLIETIHKAKNNQRDCFLSKISGDISKTLPLKVEEDENITKIIKQFEEGKIGANTIELKQIEEIIRIIKDYILGDWEHTIKYSDKTEKARVLHANKIITYTYLSRRLISQVHFKSDRLGATAAIKRVLQIMADRDYLKEVSKAELNTKFGSTQRAFMVSDANILK